MSKKRSASQGGGVGMEGMYSPDSCLQQVQSAEMQCSAGQRHLPRKQIRLKKERRCSLGRGENRGEL